MNEHNCELLNFINKSKSPFHAVSSIETMLEGEKLSSAGQIRLTSANYVVFSDFRSGYRINFRVNDQATRKAEL